MYDTYQVSALGGWIGDYPLPGNFYDFAARCQGPPRYARYCNPEIEAKAQQARAPTRSDPTASLALWTQVDRMLTDDAALVPLMARIGAVVVALTSATSAYGRASARCSTKCGLNSSQPRR